MYPLGDKALEGRGDRPCLNHAGDAALVSLPRGIFRLPISPRTS
jgi:hypothetical protein